MNYLFFALILSILFAITIVLFGKKSKKEDIFSGELIIGTTASGKVVRPVYFGNEKDIVDINNFLGCGKELLEEEPCWIKSNYKFE